MPSIPWRLQMLSLQMANVDAIYSMLEVDAVYTLAFADAVNQMAGVDTVHTMAVVDAVYSMAVINSFYTMGLLMASLTADVDVVVHAMPDSDSLFLLGGKSLYFVLKTISRPIQKYVYFLSLHK
jgi:hypothetical protein